MALMTSRGVPSVAIFMLFQFQTSVRVIQLLVGIVAGRQPMTVLAEVQAKKTFVSK